MPRYDFLCRACEREFSKILALSKYAKGGIVCPHCKSKNEKRQARKRVSQARYSARAFLSGMSRAWFARRDHISALLVIVPPPCRSASPDRRNVPDRTSDYTARSTEWLP